MKLLATVNETHAVFSVGHHDFRMANGLMADGGQPGLQDWAGYTRASHPQRWIELPNVTFAELYTDYACSQKRLYGIHTFHQVRLLEEKEIPDTCSFEWQLENMVWGTRGPKGNQPLRYILLKDASTDHLKAILDHGCALKIQNTIRYILCTRSCETLPSS